MSEKVAGLRGCWKEGTLRVKKKAAASVRVPILHRVPKLLALGVLVKTGLWSPMSICRNSSREESGQQNPPGHLHRGLGCQTAQLALSKMPRLAKALVLLLAEHGTQLE